MSMDFGSSIGSSSLGSGFGVSSSNKSSNNSAIMENLRQQIAVANAQELISKMSDKCFQKCVSKPGVSLDNSEQKCVAMCMDRYMDAWNLVSQTYTSRLSQEHGQLASSGM
ncbi:mitochondrial import inner membrane translocase subunit Tim13-B [Hydra vulgaris]|uniref:Mitochondrial import inner membrane translocase subunit n=1 Tax=Hydra vulgaris TaxID=6087 RepID=T2M326_HYDVU|nr:mitochondrial import inner membrane translocase subunit Tim13-B [Hydra vulgaris]XP_012555344.1 mitochondrial import inner membrane translocase subunit Tim13-B [Hydra vulgaris]XP_012555345.1 mitochondrial import inner membrane translocase subunit Tim13-B [Hydra vulgaris]